MPPRGVVHTVGRGPAVVFIHGTAADKTSWRALVALIRDRVSATVYDRRGAWSWPLADGDPPPLVSDHADDAAAIIASLGTAAVHVCGISFGAVVALDLIRRRPDLVQSAVLFEPALAPDDHASSVPRDLVDNVGRLVGEGDVEQAGEYFCRRVLGSAAWNVLPAAVRQDMRRRGLQIHHDLLANAAYRVCYQELATITVPVLLLKGGRSRDVFEPTLESLQGTLRRAQRGRLEHAQHVPTGEAWREFAVALTEFIGS